jgi:hypothetical protein
VGKWHVPNCCPPLSPALISRSSEYQPVIGKEMLVIRLPPNDVLPQRTLPVYLQSVGIEQSEKQWTHFREFRAWGGFVEVEQKWRTLYTMAYTLFCSYLWRKPLEFLPQGKIFWTKIIDKNKTRIIYNFFRTTWYSGIIKQRWRNTPECIR